MIKSLKEIGIVGLLMGRKGTFALLTLAVSTIVLLGGHLDGTAFGVVVSVICSSLFASHAYQTAQSNNLPDRGKL